MAPRLPPTLPRFPSLTRSPTQTHTHSVIYAYARIAHTSSSGLPRLRWTTALPLCCTLLHLDLWASCIFNQGNLHRPCVCRRVLRQIDCLRPYLYSPLTPQLLFWRRVNRRPWYRRLSDDTDFITHSDLRGKRDVLYGHIHCARPSVLCLLGLSLHKAIVSKKTLHLKTISHLITCSNSIRI